MAREQRNDVDYFPHACTHGRKMHIIETKYGNDGYAAWFKLLEQLGKANFHYIDISDEMNLMFIVSTFKVSQEKALNILNDLSKLGAIDSYLYDNHKIIFSHKFIDSVKDAYRKRKSEITEYSALLIKLGIKTSQSGGSLAEDRQKIDGSLNDEQAQNHFNLPEVIPKEKERKVKYSKEKENKQKEGGFENSNSAYVFLKTEYPATIEAFEMQNKKSFENYDVFIQNFESNVIMESIPFETEKLYARLQKLNANWNHTPKAKPKFNNTPEPNSWESGKLPRKN